MRYTSLLNKSAAGFGIGTIAVLSLSAPASALDSDDNPATGGGGSVQESRIDDPAVRQELNQTDVLPGPVVMRIDDPGVRQELNQIDSPVPAAPAEVTEPLTVFIDDNAIEFVQVAIGGLAGGLLVGAGAVALGFRHRHHAVQGA